MQDLRNWIKRIEEIGQLKRISGVDSNLEMGVLTEESTMRKGPALLFDAIPGLRPDFKILTNILGTPERVSISLKLPKLYNNSIELSQNLIGKPATWEEESSRFPVKVVQKGPILENVLYEKEVDLNQLPAPLWHEKDGGRYIGTGCVVVLRDPDTQMINVGCYRIMLQDRNTVTLYISIGKHGNIIMNKYRERNQVCPVAISLGHHPAILIAADQGVPRNIPEYNYAGAILKEPVEVIEGTSTGLPIPAWSEIVLEGFSPPGETLMEGPFGEWTGYYGGEKKPAPVVRIRNILHRKAPIALGCSPAGRGDFYEVIYWAALFRSATLKKSLDEAGVPGVRGVWPHEFGGARQFLAVSIKQEFSGHSRQAAYVASQCREGAYAGRYVVVVDDDIDPTDIKEVLWAMCTRVDPAKDIDFIRKAWSTRLDTMKSEDSVPEADAFYNTRAIIDACIPYERRKTFPERNTCSPEVKERVLEKWKKDFQW
ncbi:MAG: UbiD family decarboxylase [Deltaproteobacteria bacterium]